MVTENDRKLVLETFLANRSEANRNAVIAVNVNLIYAVMKKFGISGDMRDDSLQEGMIGLYKAVNTFDPANGGLFSTWAWLKVVAEVQIGMEREYRQQKCRSITQDDRNGKITVEGRRVEFADGEEESVPDTSPSPFETLSRNAARRKIREVLNTFTFTDREEAIIRDHIVNDVPLATLAPCFGVTKQALHATKQALLRRIEKKMVAA